VKQLFATLLCVTALFICKLLFKCNKLLNDANVYGATDQKINAVKTFTASFYVFCLILLATLQSLGTFITVL